MKKTIAIMGIVFLFCAGINGCEEEDTKNKEWVARYPEPVMNQIMGKGMVIPQGILWWMRMVISFLEQRDQGMVMEGSIP